MKIAEILTHVTRGEFTESIHRGHIAVVDLHGSMLASLGNPEAMIFARSAAKPLQAITVVEAGAIEKFGIQAQELAIMCASHNGEEEHTSTVASLLNKLQLSEQELTCGTHYPYHEATYSHMRAHHIDPTAIHNNCSGKHSGMLALALAQDVDPKDYASIQHPVQQLMLEAVAEMSKLSPEQVKLGVDGCGVPVFGLPLYNLALAFARLGNPSQLSATRSQACLSIVNAIRHHPTMIAGEDRFDTQLIEASQGQIIGKMGAEGVFALAIPDASIGMAFKVEDGSLRALYPAVVEALAQLGYLSSQQINKLEQHQAPEILNRRGDRVGTILPTFTLQRSSK